MLPKMQPQDHAALAYSADLVHAAAIAPYEARVADILEQGPTHVDALLARTRRDGTKLGDDRAARYELDYLEGLFKKLRFSYREQLTKETVVRRILELELPLLRAADMDRMAADTSEARHRLQASKAQARTQSAAAEQGLRRLLATRQATEETVGDVQQLPKQLRRLRRLLARRAAALQAELVAVDTSAYDAIYMANTTNAADTANGSVVCETCGHRLYTAEFLEAHMAVEHGKDDTTLDDEEYDALAMRPCPGCDQNWPKKLLDGPQCNETHAAFHARAERTAEEARANLSAMQAYGADWPFEGDTAKSEQDLNAARDREASAREEAERQAEIEASMVESLAHLRAAVGSIRTEMARLERQDRGNGAALREDVQASQGRTLQEQTEVLGMLLGT